MPFSENNYKKIWKRNWCDKHIWQQIIQKYVFNEIGFNCPQELIPKFITEIKKYAKQYIQQSALENAKIFTLNTLIEKSELKLTLAVHDDVSHALAVLLDFDKYDNMITQAFVY